MFLKVKGLAGVRVGIPLLGKRMHMLQYLSEENKQIDFMLRRLKYRQTLKYCIDKPNKQVTPIESKN